MGGPAVSLLWPGEPPTAAVSASLSPAAAEDLNLSAVVAAIVGSEGSRIRLQQRDHFVRQALGQLNLDPEVIGYRQAVLRDLLSDPALAARLREILPQLEELSEVRAVSERYRPSARQTLERIVRRLANLSPDLAVQSASILGFGTERIDGRQALLGRLLGGSAGTHGITPLRRAERPPEGMQNELERDLTRLLQDVAAPVATALARRAITRRCADPGAWPSIRRHT